MSDPKKPKGPKDEPWKDSFQQTINFNDCIAALNLGISMIEKAIATDKKLEDIQTRLLYERYKSVLTRIRISFEFAAKQVSRGQPTLTATRPKTKKQPTVAAIPAKKKEPTTH